MGGGPGGLKEVYMWNSDFTHSNFYQRFFFEICMFKPSKGFNPNNYMLQANPHFFYLRALLLQKSGKHNLNYFFAKCWAFLNDSIYLHYLQLSKKLIIIIYIIYSYQRYYRNACQSALWYFCGCNNIWLSISYCLFD